MYAKVLKANPYHDKDGKFSSKDSAATVVGIPDNYNGPGLGGLFRTITASLGLRTDSFADRRMKTANKVMSKLSGKKHGLTPAEHKEASALAKQFSEAGYGTSAQSQKFATYMKRLGVSGQS